jgi:hypothetical protein
MQGNPQETLFAYIAGIIDGEGTIFISKCVGKKTMKSMKLKNPKYHVGIAVAMTCEAPCKLIYDTTNLGHIWRLGVRKNRERHKEFYCWKIQQKDEAIQFIGMIRKYLLVKHEQADLLVDFCQNWKIPFDRAKGLDPDELQRREEAYQKMRKLNRLGVLATTESTGAERPSDSLNCMETCRE